MNRKQNYFNKMDDVELAWEKERGSGKGLFLIGIVVGIAATLLIVAVCALGIGIENILKNTNDNSAQMRFSEDSAVDADLVTKLQVLEETIEEFFYLDAVSDEELQNGIYKGLLDALGDPYSEYYTAEELTSLLEQSEGIYYGIGAYIGLDTATQLPKISSVIEGSPAEDAQLRANDLIYEVDGVSTYGFNLTEAVAMIKGPEGTEVVLTLLREGDYLDVTLTRRRVESPTVEFSMLEDDMAYIQVVEFDDVTIDQFADALAAAEDSNAKGIILDLRGNPGGNLNAVIEMCRMILPEGLIVYTEDKKGTRSEYKCDGSKELELPLVVLVDRNSASAAEIMAGAIKDYGIGTLVGTTTFGKGIVQQVMRFSDGTAVKVTISAYYTPNGNNIHGIGIEPDVECLFDSDAYYGSNGENDNQLEKAKEVLKGLLR